MPKHCPSADEITLALHRSLPTLQEDNDSGTLICIYHNAPSANGEVVQLGFNPLPAGTTPDVYKKTEQASLPTAEFVPGIGDGAFYYTSASLPSEMKFISHGVSIVIVTFAFTADKAHMSTLADDILQG